MEHSKLSGRKLSLRQATNAAEIDSARELLKEYELSLGISLCFQHFDEELANLPGDYSPPDGRLFLAFVQEQLVGCIALRKIDENTCEMKRLFIRPVARGSGLGRKLVERIIEDAKQIGYSQMRLDTMPGRMDEAIALYRSVGFQEIPPYYASPVGCTLFMELMLR